MEHLTSISGALEAIGFGRWQWWMLVVTGCAWVTYAAEVVMVGYLGKSVACAWGLSDGQESVLLAIGNAGSLVGLYLFGAASDTVGRKRSLMASAVLQCAFGAASAAAPNYGSLVFFRFMHGLAVAGSLSAIILFAEMVPPTNRALWSTLMQFWSIPGFATLFSRRLLWTSVLLFLIWGCSGFVYLGMVLLTPSIGAGDGTTLQCQSDGTASWGNADFTAVMVTCVAEAPGFIVVMLLSDRIGWRWTLDALFAASALGSILLACKTWVFGWQLAILFIARAGIAGVYCCLYVFTLEIYPTHARNFGSAVADGFGRIGAFAAPFAVVPFIDQDAAWKVATVLAALCGAAILCCLLLPLETMGRGLSRRPTRSRSRLPPSNQELLPSPGGSDTAAAKALG
ncbi:synaptic vesicle 2-related [Chlorella sorokiniana]|uniref:Synaptic vesicle 2-related n=1 Tax=Chlorella sorokiniana TaxID=3076 RepID=A0A2P6TQN6_CHLSO|nr:synaptic vesicle 2-related [Chlorella sorokiniana]|eukprot:PRW56349.1 synaptic vesicle 2-related [Chlorella sorokiniana]